MRVLWLILVAAVELGGPFGSASATAESLDSDSVLVDLEVEVTASAQAVVAHLGLPGEPELVLPLLDRGNGVFGLRTELERKDYSVVFELIGAAGASSLSETVSLSRLGADLGESEVPGGPIENADDDLSDETQRVGWLALALGAASLSALAFWVLGDREKAAPAEEE